MVVDLFLGPVSFFECLCPFSPPGPLSALIIHPTATPSPGYAVTAGHFSQLTATDVVGGAPQDGGVGKVRLLIKHQHTLLDILTEFLGKCTRKHFDATG